MVIFRAPGLSETAALLAAMAGAGTGPAAGLGAYLTPEVMLALALGAERRERAATTLIVELQDRAAMHGFIQQLETFGLELVELRPSALTDAPDEADADRTRRPRTDPPPD